MDARLINICDYEKLTSWWHDNRFTPPGRDMLPENGTGGLIITNNDIDVCAGFIYFTNSSCAWLEWIVADFNYRESDREECILFLIEALKEVAKQKGFKYMFASVKNKSLVSKYKKCGFVPGDSNSQEMITLIQ